MADPRGTPIAPDRHEVEQLLRNCVQCGLCLPHCATWLATGNEVQSPRGRLILLGEMLAEVDPMAQDTPLSFLQALDQCIGCRACETACPSGVPFSLLDLGKTMADSRPHGAVGEPGSSVPGFIARRLDRTGFLKFLGGVAGWARGVLGVLAGKNWRKRLTKAPGKTGNLVRLLGSVPTAPGPDAALIRLLDGLCRWRTEPGPTGGWTPDAGSADGPEVAFFTGCANAGLLGPSSRRLREVLRAAGCRLEVPAGQECCGALAAHTGRPGRAAGLRSRNRDAFAAFADKDAVILVEAAGCGHELRQYGGDFSSRVADSVVFLSTIDLPDLGGVPLKVAYHDPCHARHGQGIVAEPRRLLAAIPELTVVEPEEPEVCCGSGGAWGMRYPEMSEALGRRKAGNLAASGADLIVTANPGCMGQINDALRVTESDLSILPLTDLLWYAVVRGKTLRNRSNPS